MGGGDGGLLERAIICALDFCIIGERLLMSCIGDLGGDLGDLGDLRLIGGSTGDLGRFPLISGDRGVRLLGSGDRGGLLRPRERLREERCLEL